MFLIVSFCILLPAGSLVVSLGKALIGTPPPLCGRQVARLGEGWATPGVSA